MGLSINQQKNLEEKLCSKDFRNPLMSTAIVPSYLSRVSHASLFPWESSTLLWSTLSHVSLADWSPDKNSGGNEVSINIYVFKWTITVKFSDIVICEYDVYICIHALYNNEQF